MTYLNMKTSLGTETVDQLNKTDFSSYKEFKKELWRLAAEYRLSGHSVYFSQRGCRDWMYR